MSLMSNPDLVLGINQFDHSTQSVGKAKAATVRAARAEEQSGCRGLIKPSVTGA